MAGLRSKRRPVRGSGERVDARRHLGEASDGDVPRLRRRHDRQRADAGRGALCGLCERPAAAPHIGAPPSARCFPPPSGIHPGGCGRRCPGGPDGVPLPAPIHADRPVVRYGLCSACLSNLTATTQRFLAKGALPGADTLAAQALKHVDLDAAERARWSWTEGARALHAALQQRDTQVATMATSQDATEQVATMATSQEPSAQVATMATSQSAGVAASAEESQAPAPVPSPAPADVAPTAAAPAATASPDGSPAPGPVEEDAALLSGLAAQGFVETTTALSPLARAAEIAARQAELQAELVRLSALKEELFALEAEKIVAESEAILAAGLPEDPGALLPALPADARTALLSCIDRELWGRRVRTLHSIARAALDDHADAQAAASPSSDGGADSAAAK